MSHGRNHGSRVRWRLRRQEHFGCEPSRWRRVSLGATKTGLSRLSVVLGGAHSPCNDDDPNDRRGKLHPAFVTAGRTYLRNTNAFAGSFSHGGGAYEDCTMVWGTMASAEGGRPIQALEHPPPIPLPAPMAAAAAAALAAPPRQFATWAQNAASGLVHIELQAFALRSQGGAHLGPEGCAIHP